VLFEKEEMLPYASTILDYVNKKYKIVQVQDDGYVTLYLPLAPKRQGPAE
jgi:hypothetical protein